MKRVLQITEPEADSEDDELANKRYICASWHFKKEEERDNINEEWSHLFKVTKETWPRLTLCNRHHAISQGMSQAYDGDDRFINLLHAWMIKGSPKQKRGGPFRQAVGDANVAIKTLVALRKAKKDWKRKNNLEARGGYGVTIDDGYNSYDTDYDEWDAWEESQCGDSGFGKW